jgi:hypothetical protein
VIIKISVGKFSLLIIILFSLFAGCAPETQQQTDARATEFALSVKQTQVAYDGLVVAYIATKDHLERISTQEAANSYAAVRATQTATIANTYVYPTQVVIEVNRRASRDRAITVFLWVILVGLSLVLVVFLAVLVNLKWLRGQPAPRPSRIIDGLAIDKPYTHEDDFTSQVLAFLRAAIQFAGAGAATIPGHRELPGYQSGSRWSNIVEGLKKSGAVITNSKTGTHIRAPYSNLGRLYQAILSGSLVVRAPLPTGPDSRQGPIEQD